MPILVYAQTEIYDKWDELTGKYISQSFKENIEFNSVDYAQLKNDTTFSEIIELLMDFDISQLQSKNQKLAFWINVYNIAAIKVVSDDNIPKSIKDAGSLFKPVWKNDAINVGGIVYSLGEIEHKVLRPMNEPLIHFGIVCASLSCPDLRNEAYRPQSVIEQLTANTKSFLLNTSKGLKSDQSRKVVELSAIFKWFEDDFAIGIPQFIFENSGIDVKGYKIKYLDYNWDLNNLEIK
jgi:hypothetical protein